MKAILDLIDQGRYAEALRILLKMDGQYLYKFYCLFELEKYDEIVFLYNEKKNYLHDDQDDIIGYYIIALMKIKDYATAIDCVNAELDMLSLDDPRYLYYKDILINLYNMVAQDNKQAVKSNLDYHKVKYYLLSTDYSFQESIINQLTYIDVSEYLDIFSEYFKGHYSSYLKTQLLFLLIKNKCPETFHVFKNGLEYEIVPSLQDLDDFESLLDTCVDVYSSRIADVAYLESCVDTFVEYANIVYPALIDENDLMYTLAIIEAYVYFLSDEELLEQFEDYYDYDMLMIEQGVAELNIIFSEEEKYRL